MAGYGAHITFDHSLGDNLRAGREVFISTLEAELTTVAASMEMFAKTNHPWQNQTGQAEASFTVRVVNRSEIIVRHGVPYGIWLEVKYGGRWGVIPATVEYGAAEMAQAERRAWSAAWRFQ